MGEVLAAKGFLKETPALIAACDTVTARYIEWRARYGEQFSATGTGFHAEDPSATHRDTDWSRKDQVVLSASGGTARLVNDEAILPARTLLLEAPGDILGPYLRKAAKSNRYEAEDEVEASRDAMPEGLFSQLPVHPYVLMFHLDLHQHLWVHVDDMAPYAYQPALKQKLVLPPEQTDLIDILTAEMDVLMDDIVAGKSGGTTVLCAGPPGVGKTLTAEVYSEIIRRPLYRVHSGQLGLNVAQMEGALKQALPRRTGRHLRRPVHLRLLATAGAELRRGRHGADRRRTSGQRTALPACARAERSQLGVGRQPRALLGQHE